MNAELGRLVLKKLFFSALASKLKRGFDDVVLFSPVRYVV